MAGWKLPGGHGIAAATPAGQALPAGHGVVAAAVPLAHRKPAGQVAFAARVPADGQANPGTHGEQSAAAVAPVVAINEPAGQDTGAPLPSGQYAPGGQMAPATPSRGAGTVELPLQ